MSECPECGSPRFNEFPTCVICPDCDYVAEREPETEMEGNV